MKYGFCCCCCTCRRDMNMKRFCAERETTQYLRKPQLSKREEQQQHYLMELGKDCSFQARYTSCDATTQTRKLGPKTFPCTGPKIVNSCQQNGDLYIWRSNPLLVLVVLERAPNIPSGDRRTGKQLTNTLSVETIHIGPVSFRPKVTHLIVHCCTLSVCYLGNEGTGWWPPMAYSWLWNIFFLQQVRVSMDSGKDFLGQKFTFLTSKDAIFEGLDKNVRIEASFVRIEGRIVIKSWASYMQWSKCQNLFLNSGKVVSLAPQTKPTVILLCCKIPTKWLSLVRQPLQK